MQRSIYRKTVFLSIAAILLLCTLMSVFIITQNRKHMVMHFTDYSSAVALQIEPMVSWDDRVHIKSTIDSIESANANVEYVFIERDHKQYMHTFSKDVPKVLLDLHDESGHFPSLKEVRTSDGKRIYDIAIAGNEGTIFHVGINKKGIDKHVFSFVVGIWIIGVVVLFMTVYFTRVMSFSFEREINKVMMKDREKAERLRSVLESANEGFLVVRSKGQVVQTNTRFVELWNLPPALVDSFRFEDIVRHIRNQLAEPKDYATTMESILLSRDMTTSIIETKAAQFFEIYSCPLIVNRDLEGRIWSFRDITARINAAELQMTALEQEKMAAIGRIAGKIAHDFNNILGIIMGTSQLLLTEDLDPEIKAEVDIILENTRKGRDLTHNLLVFAKDQEARISKFNVNEKIELLVRSLKFEMKGIDVSVELDPDITYLYADAGLLENAVVNLIQNSIHALSKEDSPEIHVRTYVKNKYLCIEVEDNGCGIPADYIEKIFDPLVTLKGKKDNVGAYSKEIKGSGYGLANVKRCMDKHGGKIEVESEPGSGATFRLLCMITEENISEQTVKAIKKNTSVVGGRILIVEDEPDYGKILSTVLKKFDHEVDMTADGNKALELVRGNEYDLVSLDFILPDISGMEVYREIRKADKTIPILFVSGNFEFMQSMIDLKKYDDNVDYIAKPFNNEDYIYKVHLWLEKLGVKNKDMKSTGT